MRVAYVLLGSTIGGAEKRITNIYNYLSYNAVIEGFEFFLIVSSANYRQLKRIFPDLYEGNLIVQGNKNLVDNENDVELRSLTKKVKIKKSKKFKFLRKVYNNIFAWRRLIMNSYFLYKSYKNYNIDIAHTVSYGAYATAFLRLFVKKPYHILNYMDINHSSVSIGYFNLPNSYQLSIEKCDLIDFLGENYFNTLERRFPKLKIQKYCIAPNSFTNYEGTNNIYNKENIVVFAGRLEKSKNPKLFVEVCHRVTSKRNDIKFILCGKGPLETEINSLIIEYDLSMKVQLGFSYDTNKLFKISKIFVSLQLEDNYPSQSILEAMSNGNVVIATNVGDTYKIVNEKNGFLVDFNVEEISNKIEYLIDNPDIFNVMSKKSFDYIKDKHNISNYINYLTSLYYTLINKYD